MSLGTETELVQNAALGAVILWTFTEEYCDQCRRQSGPSLQLVLPVLPMVLDQETTESIYRRRFDGGLFLALAENRTLTLDLQYRTQISIPQTMQALNLAFATRLLSYRKDEGILWSERRTAPELKSNSEVRPLLAAAKRLGYWFSTINSEQLCSYLHLQF